MPAEDAVRSPRFATFLSGLSWFLLLALVTVAGLYLGGARNQVLGPGFLIGSALWLLLALQAGLALAQGKRLGDFVDLPVFLFLGYAVWATLRAPCEYFARVEVCTASIYGAVFLTARHQLPGRRILPWIFAWLLLVALATEAIGFLHFRVGTYAIGPYPWLGLPEQIRPDYAERMSGAFGCPNHFGNYLVQASLVALTLVIWPGLLWPVRFLALGLAAGFAAGVYFSISRGSWAAWLAGHAVWFFRFLRRGPLNLVGKTLLSLLALALVAGGFLAAKGDAVVAQRWQAFAGKGEGIDKLFSGDGNFRLELARDGIGIWQTAPWFGTGPGSFDLEHLRVTTWSHGSRAFLTHNDYVNTLADYGAVGAGLVALFWLGVIFMLGRRSFRRTAGSKADALTGLGWALTTVMLVHAVVDFNFHIPATALSCFLLLGLATGIPWSERHGRGARWVNPLLILLCLLLAAGTAWQGGKTWAGWSALPTKAALAAQLSEEQLQAAAVLAERWDPRSPVLAEMLGDAYRLKLIDLVFSSPPASLAPAERKKQEQHLASLSAAFYLAAKERSPREDTYAVRRAQVLDLQGKFAEAEPLYLEGLKQRPHIAFMQLSYGNHLWRMGQLAEAQKYLEKAVSVGGLTRPGEDLSAGEEAKAMLVLLKEQIAKGQGKRQPLPFNPRED